MIKAYWTKLDTKQRYLVAFCAAVVLVALVLSFAVFPMWDARAKMKKNILNNSKKLEEMVKTDSDFAIQDAKISRIKNAIASRRADFTLFAHLEKKAVAANVKGSIKQMNSVQGVKSPSLEETLIDLKLEKITIKQLTDFLYEVESPSEMIKIKRITVNKMKESPEYISAQLLIASYTPASPRSGGQ
jgi:3-polyprenyl-4-hydroxybenzoate decarboxylase